MKKLQKTPITSADQPVTFSPLISTKTLGVVFAYDSSTSLETLAENLREINQSMPSDHWIDIVVVLDKGVIGYTIQFPLSPDFPGWFAGACSKDFPVPPFYIHLIKEDLGDLTLNRFFVNLMAHLTFYRKRTTLFLESVMGKHDFKCMTLQGYQYNLNRELVPCEEKHQEGKLLPSLVKFNLYSTKDGKFVGQLAWMPWQDGASISYSGFLGPPDLFFRPFFEFTKTKGIYIKGRKDADVWLSSVIPLSKDDFMKISGQFKGDIVAKFYEGDEEGPPPLTIEEYEKRKSNKRGK